MECPVCKADNPDENLFCGKCGAAFSPAIQAVDREVEKLLKEKFKDRGLVEFEVSDKLVTRFMLLLKIAAWVFAPALTIFGIAIAIIASLGFKTYTEATTTIRNAATAAVTEVNGTAKNAVEGITNSSQQAERVIDTYAKSPGLKKTVEGVEAQAKVADARVAAVLKVAEEYQKKLADLDAVRRSNPETRLGDLNPSVFSQSSSSLLAVNTVIPPALANSRYYVIGSQGEDVKTIQTQLKKRNCYAGPIGGVFDKATEDGVIAYRKAKASLPPLLNPTLYTTANSLGFVTNEGAVDNTLFTELDSPLVIARCPDR
jgi:hypothetical protein